MSKNIIESHAVSYHSEGNDIEIILQDENIWASKDAISQIFASNISDVSTHLEGIFSENELDQSLNTISFQKGESGKISEYFSFDAIVSVGYRLNTKKATQFRVWATGVLKQFIKDGFVINEELLRSDPSKLNELAAKIRELRANEKNVYASVRECFKLAASDYEPSSKEVKKFYSLLQDKFHHAITRMTASKLILDRANSSEVNMGIQTVSGALPTKSEATIGKNYLTESEIYRMHLLSEQFLLYAESTALAGKSMTMQGLHLQLDNLLRLNDYPVFDGYIDYLKDTAVQHAKKEYEAFLEIKKLEHIGIEVDLELFYGGMYDEYKEQTSQVSLPQLRKALEIQPAQ